MNPPSAADIESAYLHGRWLRSHHTNQAERMLSDLSYEVERLRAEKSAARDLSTDDIKDRPHVVFIETTTGIRFFEFEGPNDPGDQAHLLAMRTATESDDTLRRVVVAMRVRTLQRA